MASGSRYVMPPARVATAGPSERGWGTVPHPWYRGGESAERPQKRPISALSARRAVGSSEHVTLKGWSRRSHPRGIGGAVPFVHYLTTEQTYEKARQ